MNIIFLSISAAISDLNNRGIYPDLLRYMAKQGHEIFIVCPFERRTKKSTILREYENVHILGVRTLNITKSNFIEKGVATLFIENQFKWAINKFYKNYKFDLILYTTPPITFNNLIYYLKNKFKAKTYLMLKDIFPQNAVDMDLMKKKGILYNVFKNNEKKLYKISDYIGCMSQANIDYLIKNEPELNKNKIGLCSNSIDIINREVLNKKEVLLSYNIPSDCTIFLYGGNLGVPQGIPNLIAILDQFKNRDDCFFLIVGSGTKAKLISDFARKTNAKNILYLPMLKRKEYDILEACCDVGMIFLDNRFTIPNFPSRMLAYLECRLPLLLVTDNCTDVGRIAEENGFGKWSPSNDIVRTSENIEFYLINPIIRKSMGEVGFKFLEVNYVVSKAYDSIMNKINN
jgi:glycosyltransferase involved in cell wall biosynthesis